MRHDERNTGRTDLPGDYRSGERPWSVTTGKGVFVTPVIAADGTVYVGSADGYLRAISHSGRVRWRFKTGGIIDAAGVLGDDGTLTFGSGDETLYQVRSTPRAMPRAKRLVWSYKATRKPATGQLVNWWEGNVALGPDGNIFVGNTGGGAYSLTRAGKERWVHQAGNSVWTTPAFGPGGRSFWGSLDLNMFALQTANGAVDWKQQTLSYVTSSPAVSADGATVYYASFDHKIYAVDAVTGFERWQVQTGDHVYGSPALDKAGNIYIGSTDGSVYSVDPQGRVRWTYDTGDAIRGSVDLGPKPGGTGGDIAYVGSSNGKLYAIDASTGRRRWSFDTTPDDPVLRDRNDLNGSPALGRTGVYVGGEHGRVWYVPYDWCLHAADRRCDTSPRQELGDDGTRILPVTSGGNTVTRLPDQPAATTLNARLVVHRAGRTINAAMLPLLGPDSLVSLNPTFPYQAQISGDGHFLNIVPGGFLEPGADYIVTTKGLYTAGGLAVSGLSLGATDGGSFAGSFRFHVAPARLDRLPLTAGADRVAAIRIRRLAVPLPSLLPSVNQIGFDSYDLVAGTVAMTKPDAMGEGSILLWVIGGKPGPKGLEAADPASDFAFALSGHYRRDSMIVGASNLTLRFSFGDVPLKRFELRGQMRKNRTMAPGAAIYSEVLCAGVPNYSYVLIVSGICNTQGITPVTGTYLTASYARRGRMNRRPPGVVVSNVLLTRPTSSADGFASATLSVARQARYLKAEHSVSLLLVDDATGIPVAVDSKPNTSVQADSAGNVASVRLRLPKGTTVPARTRIYVMTDVFPLASRLLG